MKVISLDLETTGLDLDVCEVLEIGAVYFDTEEHTLEMLKNATTYAGGSINGPTKLNLVIDHKNPHWEPVAKEMNSWWFDAENKLEEDLAYELFEKFLIAAGGGNRISLAGANVGSFDRQFLPRDIQDKYFSLRAVEIGSVYFDGTVPSLAALMEDYLGRTCTHRAIEDAMAVAELILRKC